MSLLQDDDELDASLIQALATCAASGASAPPPSLRERVLQALSSANRFADLLDDCARLADVPAGQMDAWLRALDDAGSWHAELVPGAAIFHIEPGPSLQSAAVGFVRVLPGVTFPHHAHGGRERSFLVQGALRDSLGNERRRGQLLTVDESADHSFIALPGPPLIYLVVIEGGLSFGDEHIPSSDPRL